jgi:hypothetical protein
MGFATIAEELGEGVVKNLKRDIGSNSAKSVSGLIKKQGEMFEANSLEALTMKQGKRFEENEQKHISNVLNNVSQEPDLSMFRNSKGPNAFYYEAIKKQKLINEEKLWNQRAADMGQSLRMNKNDPNLDYEISKLRTNKSINDLTQSDTKLGNALKYLRNNDRFVDKEVMGMKMDVINDIAKNPVDPIKFEQPLPNNGPLNTSNPEVIRKMYSQNNDQLKNKIHDIKSSKKQEQSNFSQKMDGMLKKTIPIAVGGGLIFSMFNRGGQMSNSELYGQQPQYGGSGSY